MVRLLIFLRLVLIPFWVFLGCDKAVPPPEKRNHSSVSFPAYLSGLRVFDCDGDGRKDVLLFKKSDFSSPFFPEEKEKALRGEQWSVYTYKGRKGWRKASSVRMPKVSGLISCCENGDIDKDGDQDLVVGSMDLEGWRGWVTVLVNDGKGRFSKGTAVSVPRDPHCFAIADLDGDGDQDLAVGSSHPDWPISRGIWLGCYLLVQEKGLRFSLNDKLRGHIPWEVCAITAKDLNGDGLPEIIIGGKGHLNTPRWIGLFENQGGLKFGRGKDVSGFVEGLVSDFEWMDTNGDGLEDLVFGSSVRICKGSGGKKVDGTGVLVRKKGAPFSFEWRPLLGGVQGAPVLVGDLNGDGFKDLVVGGFGGFGFQGKQEVKVFLRKEQGGFVQGDIVDTGNERFFPLGVGDISGDGLPDIVYVRWGKKADEKNTLVLLVNRGKGRFR